MKHSLSNKEIALAFFLIGYKNKYHDEVSNLLGRSYLKICEEVSRFKRCDMDNDRYIEIHSIVNDLLCGNIEINDILPESYSSAIFNDEGAKLYIIGYKKADGEITKLTEQLLTKGEAVQRKNASNINITTVFKLVEMKVTHDLVVK